MSYKTLTQIEKHFQGFKGSTQAIYFGMAEKYHIVGSYGGHKWHRFSLKVLDAREAFPLSTRLWLARLLKQTQV